MTVTTSVATWATAEAARAAAVTFSSTSVGTRNPPPEAALLRTRYSSSGSHAEGSSNPGGASSSSRRPAAQTPSGGSRAAAAGAGGSSAEQDGPVGAQPWASRCVLRVGEKPSLEFVLGNPQRSAFRAAPKTYTRQLVFVNEPVNGGAVYTEPFGHLRNGQEPWDCCGNSNLSQVWLRNTNRECRGLADTVLDVQ